MNLVCKFFFSSFLNDKIDPTCFDHCYFCILLSTMVVFCQCVLKCLEVTCSALKDDDFHALDSLCC